MQKILLVEDEPAITETLTEFLTAEGFGVTAVSGQSGAEMRLRSGKYDLLLVDVSLAEGDGFGVCRAAKSEELPVIFLTASGDETSVVRGLDMGADDYIAKPFRPRELISRIKNVLRRYSGSQSAVKLGSAVLDTQRGTLTKNGAEISLSALEYRLLLVFVNNRGNLLSRARLLEEIWDVAGDYVNDNTLTVYIKRLREKLEDDPQSPAVIKTVRGLGYRMD